MLFNHPAAVTFKFPHHGTKEYLIPYFLAPCTFVCYQDDVENPAGTSDDLIFVYVVLLHYNGFTLWAVRLMDDVY